ALKKLELMSAPHARRILKNGNTQDVLFDKLIVGDVILLKLGDEVPADGEVIDSEGLETDESILTGESASIDKPNKSIVYAASAVVAGSAKMKVTAIGIETKIGQMALTLKRYKPQPTPIQLSISRAITWLTIGAFCLATLIFIVYYFGGKDTIVIFKTIASAAVVIVPEGLLLASSLLLAYGSIKLAQAKVLPQKLAAIEAMALLDVLCVDKTGTLTSDKIKFETFYIFDKEQENISELIGIVAKETSSGSSTGEAIIDALPAPNEYKVLQTLAFSSSRKMSGVKVSYKGKKYSIIMGAPELVGMLSPLKTILKKNIELLTNEGKRVLLVSLFDDTKTSLKDLKNGSGRAIGIVVLSNELRVGVEKTVEYLQRNGVSLRVISGDNPNTVRYVASQAGIFNHDNVITGADLQEISEKKWDKTIAKNTIFARVLPEQKERLIETFKRLGNFTGMVGDGVNDALALKKSDLGVAMYSGSVATRRVADIVLLDNSFNSLPLGMKLGNQIMQAIELVATLFFHKIIFGVVLLLTTLLFGFIYPFEPRHITFMNIFLVTAPTIMWTLFTPSPRHRLSPRYFWRDTLFAVAPIAVLSGVMITASYALLRSMHPLDVHGVSTTTVLIATFFGIYLVFLVPRMFDVRNNRKARLARLLYSIAVLSIVVPSFSLQFIRDFFNFTMPTWEKAWPFIIVIIGTAVLQWIIAGNAGKRLKKREP
ncbi:MAG: HAD-IC family P-type ATPase, partial [Candidatus Saccharibacteria bacterium]